MQLTINKKLTAFLAFLAFLFIFPNYAFSEDKTIERAKEYRTKIPVKVIKKVPLPRGYHEGLFFDGENIWYLPFEGENGFIIYQCNPDGEIPEV